MATYDFETIRKVNAVLKTKTVTLYGKQWAIDDSADGWNIINVQTPELPDTLLEFIAGNDTLTQYPFADNVDEIGAYAVSQFKALTTIYLFNTSLVELDAKAFDGLDDLEYIYVPTDLLSTYKSTYSQYESLFVALQTDYEWNVPYIEGSTFNSTLLIRLITMLSSAQKNAISRINIPTDYDASQVSYTLFRFDFSNMIPNVGSNVYYGSDKFDYTTLEIAGDGTSALTSAIISHAIEGNLHLSDIIEIKYSGYTNYDVALTYDYSSLTSLEYIWEDNDRYGKKELANGIWQTTYTQNEGKAYYILNRKIQADDVIETTVKTTSNSTSYQPFFGNISTPRVFLGLSGSQTNIRASFIENTQHEFPISSYSRNHYVMSNGHLYINGIDNVVGPITPSGSTQADENCMLFGYFYINSQNHDIQGQTQFETFSITNHGQKVVEYIPCYDSANNVYGMFDNVNNQIAEKLGEGSFSGGSLWSQITYFYPLSNFISQLGTHDSEVAYFDYNGIAPDMSAFAGWSYDWYDNASRTGTPVTSMESGKRYYLQLKPLNNSITILGSGTLTSAMVSGWVNQLNASGKSATTKVVVPSLFNTYENGCLESMANLTNSEKSLDITLNIREIQLLKLAPTFFTDTSNGLKNIYVRNGYGNEIGLGVGSRFYCENAYFYGELTANYYKQMYNGTKIQRMYFINNTGVNWFGTYTIQESYDLTLLDFDENFVRPEIRGGNFIGGWTGGFSKNLKIWFRTTAVVIQMTQSGTFNQRTLYQVYVPSIILEEHMNTNTTITTHLIGFLDYTGTVPTFTGYTPTWYSDEDCMIETSTASFISGNRYFVKLTAI